MDVTLILQCYYLKIYYEIGLHDIVQLLSSTGGLSAPQKFLFLLVSSLGKVPTSRYSDKLLSPVWSDGGLEFPSYFFTSYRDFGVKIEVL